MAYAYNIFIYQLGFTSMNTKIKNVVLMLIMLFAQASSVIAMEDSGGISSVAISDLSSEILFCVFKELVKIYIADFMISNENIDAEKLVPLKKLRLISQSLKIFIDQNKKMFLLRSLQELFPHEFETLNANQLNNKFAMIVTSEDNRENEIKAALLIMTGANCKTRIRCVADKEGQSLQEDFMLIMISKSGKFKGLIRLICHYGAEINNIDPLHGTPLMVAVKNDRKEIVRILLANGADYKIIHDGLTALDIAQNYHNQEIIDLIKPQQCWFMYIVYDMISYAKEAVISHHAFV